MDEKRKGPPPEPGGAGPVGSGRAAERVSSAAGGGAKDAELARKLDRLLETALWWKRIRETNNESFLPLFFDRHRYLVLKGGGGSGKSIFAGRKILERVTTEPGHRWLVCRKVGKTIRDSCFAQLRGQIAEHYPDAGARVNKGDMWIGFPNGSEILFAGLDDVEKLKSIYNITGIWIEEASELQEGDFNQLDIRLRTDFRYYLQMILTFNPISINHWLKKRFWDQRDPRARVHESTYRDNRFLTREAVDTLLGFQETDPYYYMVYALGQWGVTGKTVFNAAAVSARLEALKPPVMRGFFEYSGDPDGIHIADWRWVDDPDGPVKIYKRPEAGRPYVIGGDTAGDGSDFFLGQVLDNITGEQVCVLRHQYDEDTYARQMFCLGMHYNEALIAPETNFSTYPVKLLDLMGYRNLYVREVEDEFDGKIKHAFGFQTNSLTRPVMISELIRILRDNIGTVNDEDTLLEMLTFVRNEKLRPEAEPGAHDDCVMALAIAHYIRPQQRMNVETPQTAGGAKWTEDMLEDYRNADKAGRELLIQLWGPPQK